ncbi:hypothetical protein CP981_34370 [Streptomyces platensis]|uniref:DUF4352 domain-containing protein n=1 Tax=Streptomyces platensis TaxID=58346 RepID=A0AAE6NQW3_STRPT|nr:hypothetical protein [Streptomyces platensis]OSY48355.1 hypothetical protein BG653_00232 [Streptomyces platensis]QEV56016.1 hypothetical protein CP981_34370 [Streptomyces platensis]
MADSPKPQAGAPCGDASPLADSRGGPAAPDSDSPGPSAPRPRPPRNGLGIAALTFAALGLLLLATLGVVGAAGPARILFWVAGLFVTTALVLGLLGARRAKQGYAGHRAKCVTGAVLGGLATVWCLNGAVAVADPLHQVSCRPSQPQSKTSAATGSSPASFHTTYCFKNGVQATVSAPKPYTPRQMKHDWERGYTPGNRTVAVEVTIRNGSTNVVDLAEFFGIAAKDANGRTAEAVFEGDDHSRGLGKTLLLPGMTKVVTQGFALPPNASKSMAVEVSLALASDRRAVWSGPDESAWWSGRVR